MSGNGDNDPRGEENGMNDPGPGNDPKEPMAREGEEAGQNEAREKDKSHRCASGHCCGRQNTRHVTISRYLGNN
jgi:hypothetical protein